MPIINLSSFDLLYDTNISSISNLSFLTKLNLSKTSTITYDEIKNLTNLDILNLSLAHLTKILSLNLSHNSTISYDVLKKITRINILNPNNDQIISDDAIIASANLTKLYLIKNFNITDRSLIRTL